MLPELKTFNFLFYLQCLYVYMVYIMCVHVHCTISSFMLHSIYLLSLSEYPRKSLIQDGQAMLKYLMMRNSRRSKMKSESNKIVLGKLFIIVVLEYHRRSY